MSTDCVQVSPQASCRDLVAASHRHGTGLQDLRARDSLPNLVGRPPLHLIGSLARQQFIEQHAQRVHVRHRGHAGAAELLGACVLRRHHLRTQLGRQERAVAFQQFGNAEVEQFRRTVGGHENVRWFDVAMNDEMLMRVRDGRADLSKEYEPRLDRQPARPAVLVDRQAVDVLEHEVRNPFVGGPTVEQARDIRVIEAGEDLSFVTEALQHRIAVHAALDQFDGDTHVELRVRTFGEIDAPHPATSELSNDPVWTYLPARWNNRRCDTFQTRCRTAVERSRLGIGVQEAFDFYAQLVIVTARLG